MKKEIIICDKCGREIIDGEQYIQRPKDLHSNRVSDIEDVCIKCAYMPGNTVYYGKVDTDKYRPVLESC